jgi:hypothetical protein
MIPDKNRHPPQDPYARENVRATAREARFFLEEALQNIKAPDLPELDEACTHIRMAHDMLKRIAG